MWDQLVRNTEQLLIHRIIPTYVGSTQFVGYMSYDKPNHSHVCGINRLQPLDIYISTESFPRMWDQRAH